MYYDNDWMTSTQEMSFKSIGLAGIDNDPGGWIYQLSDRMIKIVHFLELL